MFSQVNNEAPATPAKKPMTDQQIKETELGIAKMGMIVSIGGLVLGLLSLMKRKG